MARQAGIACLGKGSIMAHKKYRYYVVVSGLRIGIFDNWERCREQVDRFKGNCYKGFYSLEEAVSFAKQSMNREERVTVEIHGSVSECLIEDLNYLNLTA